MHPNEKWLRYQDIQKLGRLKREGAKPSVIEQLQRSIASERKPQQKGPHLKGRSR